MPVGLHVFSISSKSDLNLKGSDDGVQHSELRGFWTPSIHNKKTFRKQDCPQGRGGGRRQLLCWVAQRELTSITGQPMSTSKLCYDLPSVGQSVLVSGHNLGPVTNFSFKKAVFWDVAPRPQNKQTNKQTPWPLVRERTIPTDRPPLVDEI
jgi:hypothetical protein